MTGTFRIPRDDAFCESDLREALSNGEFELYVQPIVAASSGKVVSCETLLRWNRPGHGVVTPGSIIALAERSALIIEIDAFMLDRCCEVLARWQHRGAAVPLAVNVSARHLMSGDLVGDVQRALAKRAIPSNLLQLELTESQLVTDLARAASVLDELRALGVRIALDDFGTGHATQAYLDGLPIDTMKIDRSYIAMLTVDPAAAAIVTNFIRMAADLDLGIVAEGVESAIRADVLADLGCHHLQGYYFAYPMTISSFEIWSGPYGVGTEWLGTEMRADHGTSVAITGPD